jgi:hypothetical protein
MILPIDFNWQEYLQLNPDVYEQYKTEKESIHHYIYNGYYENRKYKIEEYKIEEYKIEEYEVEENEVEEYKIEEYEVEQNNILKTNFEEYKHLFHKYYLNIKNYDDNITYNILYSSINFSINKILCIHCYDLSKLELYFGNLIYDYYMNYTIIITFTIGEIINNFYFDKFNSLVILKIKNKGVDIGAKLITMQYLKDIKLDYKFSLFVHSKNDDCDRNNFIKPFINRSLLLEHIFDNGIDCIFPDYNNIYINENTNNHCIYGLEKYYQEFCSYFKIKSDNSNIIFNGTNTFALSKKFIDLFSKNIKILYNNLNEENDFDYNWYKIYYNLHNLSLEETYQMYLNNNNIGNDWYLRHKSIEIGIQNCCYEHIFERMWINLLKHYNCDFIVLPLTSIKSFYNIKINAIYFPQFHNSEENNKNWGEGFTEWTLLKPFQDSITVRNNDIKIMKPHKDIGYYSLDDSSTLIKQINTAKLYNMDGFVIYHYWFGNSKSVLNKIEQHILNGYFDFPFCFSWANEPWTNQWEGHTEGGDNMLIDQNYEDDENIEHINYLLQFFKNPNYIKNIDNECLFYIYNYQHIKNNFEKITEKWIKIAKDNNIKIKFITTINSDGNNRINGTETKFLFTPMCQTNVWNLYNESDIFSNGNFLKKIPGHIEIDYENLIEDYKLIKNVDNLHLGLSLNWNNIVRKKNRPHLHINNFSNQNLEKFLYVLVSKIITKYKNKLSLNKIEKYNIMSFDINESQFNLNNNNIIINAWNEWNEQAILEPNNITGYNNLEIINSFFQKI